MSKVSATAEPFRIAGNLYYVGATDASAFLITGSEGHIVIDGGYPTTAPMIIESIAKLGFSIKDVRMLLDLEPHPDHAGGLARVGVGEPAPAAWRPKPPPAQPMWQGAARSLTPLNVNVLRTRASDTALR